MSSRTSSGGPLLVLGPLEIRPAEYTVLCGGRRVPLTVREFELLHVLALRPDRVVRRAELYDLVWGGQMAYRDRSVDVFVRKVRTKLAAACAEWTFIHTHFGVGYRLAPEPVLRGDEDDDAASAPRSGSTADVGLPPETGKRGP